MLPRTNKDELMKIFNIERISSITSNDVIKKKEYVKPIDSSKKEEKINLVFNNDTLNQKDRKIIEEPKSSENKYNFEILQYLNSNYNDLKIQDKTKINICLYKINESNYQPYIQYLLYKYNMSSESYSDLLVFPFLLYNKDSRLNEQLNDFLSANILDYKSNIISKGLYYFNKQYYAFYEFSKKKEIVENLQRKNEWWWVTSYEIINLRHVCNFKIYYEITNFFLNNMFFMNILDKTGKPYKTPFVLYNGDSESLIRYISVFGMKKSGLSSKLGPFYYFSDYKRAIRYGGWGSNFYGLKQEEIDELIKDNDKPLDEDGKYKKGGIVRFLVFYNEIKYFLNHPDDMDDNSETTQLLLKKNEYIKSMLKIRDSDGKWANNYDLCYTTSIDENIDSPTWCCKNYEQQIPISYHFIDKKTLGDKWDKNNVNYMIE